MGKKKIIKKIETELEELISYSYYKNDLQLFKRIEIIKEYFNILTKKQNI